MWHKNSQRAAFWPWTAACEQHLPVLLPSGCQSTELCNTWECLAAPTHPKFQRLKREFLLQTSTIHQCSMGCLSNANLAAYSFSCKARALSYSAHNKIDCLSFLEATRKYFNANILQGLKFHLSEHNIVIPKFCLLFSSSHLTGTIWLLLGKGPEVQSSHPLRLWGARMGINASTSS